MAKSFANASEHFVSGHTDKARRSAIAINNI
jgi:hypothetical protein